MDPSPSRLVAGRYRLLGPLGSGGMGTVWRAEDEVLGREVAVKEVTFPQGVSDADRAVLQERTRREARAAAKLDHPSAVTVFDVVEDGVPYLVMELVEGPTLAEVVRDRGPLSPQRTAEVGLSLLGALEAAHQRGIVHRDVKPSNVIVRDDGRVVLTDFGIATATGDSSLTSTGLLLGSPAYIAPERARGEAPGPPSDLWSLGATLFTAVEGKPPFDGGEPMLTVTAVVTGEHAPYAAAGPLVPVLDGLLDKDPAQRFDAGAARAALQRVATAPARPAPADPAPTVRAAAVSAPATATAAIPLGEVREDVAAVEARPAETRPAAARPALPLRSAPARRRGWAAPAAVGAVLLGVAAATVLALTSGDDRDRTAAAPSTSSSPSTAASSAPPSEAPASSEPEPAASGEPSAPAATPSAAPADGLPAGWTTDSGSAGWTVALPPGYRSAGGGEYRGPGGRTLRVETGKGQPDAVADREGQAQDFARRHPTYEEIRIDAVDYRGYEAADWEFTYEGLHVLNRVFVVDRVGHSLFFQTRERDYAAAEGEFLQIIEEFRPVGA